MKISGTDNAHLTYCLNVHPGGSLEDVESAVFERASRVFSIFSRETGARAPYGLGLWLSARAASELSEPNRLKEFSSRLNNNGFYVFTINGFPYSHFHRMRIKEKVYEPDWAESDRRNYTINLAEILVHLLPEGTSGTISTLPVTFKPRTDVRLEASMRNIGDVVLSLNRLKQDTGKEICLVLEPEPFCYLERIEDVVRFFSNRLQLYVHEAEEIVTRHLGICLDTVHAAVMFEEPQEIIRHLRSNNIRVPKVQLGAALSVDVQESGLPEELYAFEDGVYLHQTTIKTEDSEQYFLDLTEALAQAEITPAEWRVHFHVPLCWKGKGTISASAHQIDHTFLRSALEAEVEHFELEVYTLDVMPNRTIPAEEIIAQDLAYLWKLFREIRT